MEYCKASVAEYLADAASNKPAPGGGSASALAGALAAAMGEMASNFTVGKRKFRHVEAEVSDCLRRLQSDRADLLALVDADVQAYGAVSRAYGLPRDNEQQRAARTEAIRRALREAMDVPLRVMRCCARVAQVAERLASVANPNLLTDVGVSAILAEAACAAAALNVEVNLKFLGDAALAERVRGETSELLATTARCREAVERAVREHLSR